MNDQRLIIGADKAVNPSAREIVARDSFTAVQIICDVRFDERKTHLKQRDIDELPPPGLITSEQPSHDAVSCKHSRGVIRDRKSGDLGILEIRHQTQHAAERLADRIESGLVAIRSGLAVTGDRAVNKAWIYLRQFLVIEAPPFSC